MIESGHTAPEDPVVQDAVERCLQPLKGTQPDALLLGCTHYDLIGEAVTE